jgi:hypothetical protein
MLRVSRLLIFGLAVAVAVAASGQTWTREPLPGVTYKMIVQADPALVVHALGFSRDARQYWATSAAAGDTIYDTRPSLGRSTLSAMVDAAGAIGGINGDFFQWGGDPGGDPTGLMVRNGELLSHPVPRAALGWGRDHVQMVATPSWKATLRLGPLEPLPVAAFNQYAAPNALVVVASSGGLAISKIPATFLIVRTEAALVRPVGAVTGSVVGRAENVGRMPVPPGTMVVVGAGAAAEPLRRAELGEEVSFDVTVEGFDWSRIDNVMGGGPMLMRNGKVLPRPVENDPRHPRTMVGVDREGTVWYVIVDGRQPMSAGTNMLETAQVMERLGCMDAINLDGGGSSTLNLLGMVVNRPSGGIERLIANAILWFGPRPDPAQGDFVIMSPQEIKVGDEPVLLSVTANGAAVRPEEILWSAQGAAWIDQDGRLRPLQPGEARVRALLGGKIVERTVVVQP